MDCSPLPLVHGIIQARNTGGLPFSPGDNPNLGIESRSLLQDWRQILQHLSHQLERSSSLLQAVRELTPWYPQHLIL